MSKREKLKKFRVHLFGEITASCWYEVKARDAAHAKEVAEQDCGNAPWDGGDYTTPEGATVEAQEVEEIEQQRGSRDEQTSHGWRWKRDTEPRRFGLKSDAEVLKDVMYFHRYNPPTLTMHFKSGRKISYW